MSDATLPKLLIVQFLQQLEADACAMERWEAESAYRTLRSVSRALRDLLEHPAHCWVSVADAARILRRSEETIRRWCRSGTAPFRYERDDQGHYMIWLADLRKTEAHCAQEAFAQGL